MKRNLLFMALLLSSIAVISCMSGGKIVRTQSVAKPIGKWELTKLNSTELPEASSNGKTASLLLSDSTQKFTGNNGCNAFGGKVEFKGDSVKFDTQFSTKMLCLNSIDREFDSTLRVVNVWIVDNSKLILKKDKKILMEFKLNATK